MPKRAAQGGGNAGGSLAPVGFEKFEAGGGIVEYVAHDHGRPLWAAAGAHILNVPGLERDARSGIAALKAGAQLDFRHGGDRRESLAAEAHSAYGLKPALIVQLARRMAQKGDARILRLHAAAVVGHADVGRPAAAYLHGYIFRARVERVLHELLYHRGGTLHDLACGDHVRNMRR